MDLVKDDELRLARGGGAAIQHGAQDLRRHDQAGRLRIDRRVARHQACTRQHKAFAERQPQCNAPHAVRRALQLCESSGFGVRTAAWRVT